MPDESKNQDESLGLERLPQSEVEATPGSGKVPTPLDDNIHFPARTEGETPSEPINSDFEQADLLDAEALRGSKQPRSGDRDRRKETR